MKIKSFLLFFGLALFLSTALNAQPGDPNGGGKPGSVPISGIEYLLGAGALLGLKKIRKSLLKKPRS